MATFLPLRSLVFILLLPLAASATPSNDLGTLSITGTVVDAETGENLPDAHVFLAGTMRGTTSDSGGTFQFDGLHAGAHRIVVSMLGYREVRHALYLNAADSSAAALRIALDPKVIEIAGVEVEGERDRRWRKLLDRFALLFLGETEAAQSARITNPEVLDLDRKWHGRFTAESDAPIRVENTALGYRVDYVLSQFEEAGGFLRYDGEPLFEPIVPANPQQAERWEANRARAFRGSLRHFLLALLAGETESEGFRVALHRDADGVPGPRGRPIDPARLLRADEATGAQMLRFSGFVEIVYEGEREEEAFRVWQKKWPYHRTGPQRSWLRLADGPTLVDPRGEILDPYGLVLYGYFAFERLADEVPREYRPADFALAR